MRSYIKRDTCHVTSVVNKIQTRRQTQILLLYIRMIFFSYKHAIDGMARVAREEGFSKLFSGVDWATGRAVGLFFSKGILSRRRVGEGH